MQTWREHREKTENDRMKSKQAQTSGKNNFHTTIFRFSLSRISAIFVRKTFSFCLHYLSEPNEYIYNMCMLRAKIPFHKDNNNKSTTSTITTIIIAWEKNTTTCTQHIMIFLPIASLFELLFILLHYCYCCCFVLGGINGFSPFSHQCNMCSHFFSHFTLGLLLIGIRRKFTMW